MLVELVLVKAVSVVEGLNESLQLNHQWALGKPQAHTRGVPVSKEATVEGLDLYRDQGGLLTA